MEYRQTTKIKYTYKEMNEKTHTYADALGIARQIAADKGMQLHSKWSGIAFNEEPITMFELNQQVDRIMKDAYYLQ